MINVLFFINIILSGVAQGSPVIQKNIEKRYAIIIDAGSTGSRIHCFEFHTNISNGNLILDKESYNSTRPGLSSFADNPANGAESIKLLLDKAKNCVPRNKWNITPLMLKATAGLRRIPPKKAEDLLSVVRKLFAKYEFRVNNHSVEILDGISEGIFSWFSVNLLRESLSKSTQSQSAVLDLGGGSAEVTFPVDPRKHALEGDKIEDKYLHTISAFGRNITVFTNSYSGFGLSAARDAILTKSHKSHKTIVSSACFHPLMKNETFTFEDVDYQVSGKAAPSASAVFERCLQSVKFLVSSFKPKPLMLKENYVLAISGYFWVALESELLTEHPSGVLLVKDYCKKARDVCMTHVKDKPFLCFDLTYISALLGIGFNLPESQKIQVFDKIGEYSISWALGAAYHYLTGDIQFH